MSQKHEVDGNLSRHRLDRDVPAFKPALVRSRFDDDEKTSILGRVRLYEFEDREDFVIRRGDLLDSNPIENDVIQACRKIRHLFVELAQKYGVPAPVHFVVAQDSGGQAAIYILTETVCTVAFDTLEGEEKRRAAEAMGTIFEALLRYYEDKVRNGEDCLLDLPDRRQFVYGNLAGQSLRSWHLIDTDPFYSSYSRDQERLFDLLVGFEEVLESIEEDFSINLSKVRERCHALLDSMEAATGED